MDKWTGAYAKQLDEADVLKGFRGEFYLNNESVYMDGNSLGLLSKRAEQSTLELLESWKRYGIDGWMEGEYPWYYLSDQLGDTMAPLVGAIGKKLLRQVQQQ